VYVKYSMNKLVLIQCQNYLLDYMLTTLTYGMYYNFLFKGGEEEEEEPPKVIVNEIKEDDAFYSKK